MRSCKKKTFHARWCLSTITFSLSLRFHVKFIHFIIAKVLIEPVLGAFYGRGSKVYQKNGTKFSGTKVQFLEPKNLYHFEPIPKIQNNFVFQFVFFVLVSTEPFFLGTKIIFPFSIWKWWVIMWKNHKP